MTDALCDGSPTAGAAALASPGNISVEDATALVEHALVCVYSWPRDATQAAVLGAIDQAFALAERPQHFTDHTHCSECAEHDQTLQNRTLTTIVRADLGSQAWDPMIFTSDQGWAYYMPAIARFAMAPAVWRDADPYIVQFAGHLSLDGPANRRLRFCTTDQRLAIADLLNWISANEKALGCSAFTTSDFRHESWTTWSDGTRIWRGGQETEGITQRD